MTVQEHQNDLFQLSREIKALNEQINRLVESHAEIEEECQRIAKENEELHKRCEYLERYSEKLKSELTDYQANPSRIGEGWVSHNAVVGELLEEIAALREALKAKEREIADLTAQVGALQGARVVTQLIASQAADPVVTHTESRPLHAEAISESTNSAA